MGAVVNAIVIIIAGGIGLFLNKGIPQDTSKAVMSGIGLTVAVMGIQGALTSNNQILLIVSIVVGAIIGESLKLEQRTNRVIEKLERKYSSPKEDGTPSLTEGFIAATSIFCVGSMVIIGSLESGLLGDNTTLYTKSLIDGITALFLASSLGKGVLLSAIPILIIEGGLILFANMLQPILTAGVVTEIVATGSVLLIGLGLNIMNVTDLKILNYMPAMLIPPIVMTFL